jgi:hypothetical protein
MATSRSTVRRAGGRRKHSNEELAEIPEEKVEKEKRVDRKKRKKGKEDSDDSSLGSVQSSKHPNSVRRTGRRRKHSNEQSADIPEVKADSLSGSVQSKHPNIPQGKEDYPIPSTVALVSTKRSDPVVEKTEDSDDGAFVCTMARCQCVFPDDEPDYGIDPSLDVRCVMPRLRAANLQFKIVVDPWFKSSDKLTFSNFKQIPLPTNSNLDKLKHDADYEELEETVQNIVGTMGYTLNFSKFSKKCLFGRTKPQSDPKIRETKVAKDPLFALDKEELCDDWKISNRLELRCFIRSREGEEPNVGEDTGDDDDDDDDDDGDSHSTNKLIKETERHREWVNQNRQVNYFEIDILAIVEKKKEPKKKKKTQHSKREVNIFEETEEEQANELQQLWQIHRLDITMMNPAEKIDSGYELRGMAQAQDLGLFALDFKPKSRRILFLKGDLLGHVRLQLCANLMNETGYKDLIGVNSAVYYRKSQSSRSATRIKTSDQLRQYLLACSKKKSSSKYAHVFAANCVFCWHVLLIALLLNSQLLRLA